MVALDPKRWEPSSCRWAASDGLSHNRSPQSARPGRQMGRCVGDYPLVPDELKLLHCEDFRDDSAYAFHLDQLIRILREPPAPLAPIRGGERVVRSCKPANPQRRVERRGVGSLHMLLAFFQRSV
jgi:hypothetical protein